MPTHDLAQTQQEDEFVGPKGKDTPIWLNENTFSRISVAQIRSLMAFVNTRSVSAAAKKLDVVPSTVSRQLIDLGKIVKVDLGQINGKDLKPTVKAFELASRLERPYTELHQFVVEENDRILGVVFSAGASSLHSLVMPNFDKLRSIFAKSPIVGTQRVKLHAPNIRSHETVRRVVEGRADFGVARASAATNERNLTAKSIGTVGYCMIVNKHLLKEIRSFDDVVKKPVQVLTLAGSGNFKRKLRTELSANNLQLDLGDEVDFFSDVVTAVRFNPIAGIVPITALANEPDTSSFRAIRLDFLLDYVRPYVLVFNPRLALDKFVPAGKMTTDDRWKTFNEIVERIVEVLERAIREAIARVETSYGTN